jgi:hypothetical protein
MVFHKLVKTHDISIEGQTYTVRYYEAKTLRGTQRYSSEVVLGPGDRIIVDGSSLADLEWRVARMIPATLHSRALAARAVAA